MEEDLRGDLNNKYSNAESRTKSEHLKERLYSRESDGFLPWRARKKLGADRPKVDTDWSQPKELPIDFTPHKTSSPGIAMFFAASLIFLIVAGAFALNYLRTSSAVVSASEIDLQVTGPQTVLAGEVIELQIVAANRSEGTLDLADLVIEYPKGARSASDFTEDLISDRLPIGRLSPRSIRRGTIRAVLLGKDGERQHIKLALEYRVKGGDVIYTKETEYAVLLTAGALTVSVAANKEATTGQETDLEATITSHAVTTLHDVLLKVQYPFGFTQTESAPEATTEGLWELGDFFPGEQRKVHIRGRIVGEDNDKRIFKFSAGTRIDKEKQELETPLIAYNHSLTVKDPFLATELLINGESPELFTFQPGLQSRGELKFKNALNVPITGATIAITLGGTALNKAGVKVEHGFYRSTDSIVLWDQQSSEQLKNLTPGKEGTLNFTIQTLPEDELQHVDNPSITFDLHAAGRRLTEKGVPENMQATSTHIAKVGTKVTLTAEGKYFTSPFPKRGPLPPRVEVETIYGITFDLKNTSNRVDNAEVVAVLPPNVRWTGVRTPAAENIVFDDRLNTITWHVGSLISGAGVAGEPSRSVSFAIGLVPSASQINEEPDLVRGIRFRGVDSFTGDTVEQAITNVNTRLTEEGFNEKYADVEQQ